MQAEWWFEMSKSEGSQLGRLQSSIASQILKERLQFFVAILEWNNHGCVLSEPFLFRFILQFLYIKLVTINPQLDFNNLLNLLFCEHEDEIAHASEDIVPFAGDHSLLLSFRKVHSGYSVSYMNMNTKVPLTMLANLLPRICHLNVWLLICRSLDLGQ